MGEFDDPKVEGRDQRMQKLGDICAVEGGWDLNEDVKDPVGGKGVLGRVVGPFFVPDGVSRNRRFYPESLWNSVLGSSEVQSRLNEKMMFGCLGHEDKIVFRDDEGRWKLGEREV